MNSSMRLQLLTCLVVYASSAHAIMVKFGTKGGPIEPPPPVSTLPPPQPYRTPAPVWEERSNDAPDPNAQWRPQLFIPQPRYTQVEYNNYPESTARPLSNAQRFVNSYTQNPRSPHQAIQAQPYPNLFSPAQILSSQSLPGYGIRYFLPTYLNQHEQKNDSERHEDAAQNEIETNDFNTSKDSANDLQWKFEKDNIRRNTRHTVEAAPYPYLWPAYVPSQY